MRTWIFQGNPDDYDIDRYLSFPPVTTGLVNSLATRCAARASSRVANCCISTRVNLCKPVGVLTVWRQPLDRAQRNAHVKRAAVRSEVAIELCHLTSPTKGVYS